MFKFLNWKVRYFQGKRNAIEKMVCDLEFKRYKTLQIREKLRYEMDGIKFKLDRLNVQIEQEKSKPTMSADELKRLEDQKIIFERDIERLIKGKPDDPNIVCIEGLDYAVFGSRPTNEYPQGIQGVNQEIEGLRELSLILRDYIKTL